LGDSEHFSELCLREVESTDFPYPTTDIFQIESGGLFLGI